MGRKRIFAVASVLTAGLLLVSCRQQEDRAVGMVEVEAVRVKGSTDIRTTPYVGKITAAQSSMLASAHPGRLESIDVRKGQVIKRGETVARISSEAINSAYTIAEVTLRQAQDGYDRMMQVYKDGGVTELKKIEVETQLAKAEAAMKSAASAKEKCQIKAPFDAIVEDIFIEKGIEVNPALPLMKLSNVNSVEIHIPVPENEISAIYTGQQAEYEVAAVNVASTARVIVKGVSASEISHTYDVTLNPDSRIAGMLPGMVCKVFLKRKKQDKIVIPMECIMTDSEGRYVWTLSEEVSDSLENRKDINAIVSKTRIEVNDFSTEGVIVSEGLETGDLLVTEGRRKISGGMKVRAKLTARDMRED